MIRPWIGITLLGTSWLLGLDYYETASPWAQAAVLILGAWMLSTGERANPLRATRAAYPELTLAIFVLLIPVVWWSPWPYRLSPLAIIAGLLLERLPNARPTTTMCTWCPTWCPTWRPLRQAAAVCITGGVILLVQAVALTFYAAATRGATTFPPCWLNYSRRSVPWRESMRPAMDQRSSCSRCGSRTGWPSPGTSSSIRPR